MQVVLDMIMPLSFCLFPDMCHCRFAASPICVTVVLFIPRYMSNIILFQVFVIKVYKTRNMFEVLEQKINL